MDLRDDERAQTVQVGAILLLGTLVVALSVYQVTSVPGQNSETEFTHNQQVHEQLQELRTAILETAAEGTGRSAAVALGTRYRERIVAVNPGPPSGTLRTTDLGAVAIANAVAAGNPETADFWNGSAKRYGSTALTYEPNYNEYSNAPTTVYEHSVLANRFEEGDRPTLLLSNETMVDGRDITLVTLDGSLSRTGSGTVSVDARPLSVSSTTIPIRGVSGGPVTLTLPTTLPESRWEGLLGDATFVERIEYTEASPRNRVTIRLAPGETYRLRMAKIGVGSDTTIEPATYLTDVRGSGADVPEGGTKSLVVEARDRYNNPVRNELISVSVAGTGVLRTDDASTPARTVTVETDDAGRAEVTYVAPASVDGAPERVEVRASRRGEPPQTGPFDGSTANNVTFSLGVTNTDLSLDALDLRVPNQPGIDCNAADTSCTYDPSRDDDGRFAVTANASPAVRGVGVAFSSNDTGVARYESADGRTDANGTARATVVASKPGSVVLTTRGGGRTDAVTVTTVNQKPTATFYTPTDATAGTAVTFDASNSTDPDGEIVTYEWAFGDGTNATASAPTTSHTFETPGTYEVTLTVTDGANATSTATRTVTIDQESRVRWSDPVRSPGAGTQTCGEDACQPLSLRATTDPAAENERIEYTSTNPAVASVSPRQGETGADGNATTGLAIGGQGTTGLLVRGPANDDSIGVTTLLNSGFENGGLGPDWRKTGGGRVGISDDAANGDGSAVYHEGATSGGIESIPFDTSSGGLLVVEYWAQDGLGSSVPDNGEDLIVEYRAADGTWTEIDRIEPSGNGESEYNRRIRVSEAAARHGDFALRFVKASATAADPWYVDDVRLAAVGGTASRGSFDDGNDENGESSGNDGNSANGGNGGNDGSGGDGDTSSEPSVTDGRVADRSNPGQDRYDVAVELSDPDGDLDRVVYELRDADTNETLDRETRSVSGSSDTSTARLQSGGGPNKRDRYRIVVTVYDEQGRTAVADTEVAGSG